MENYSIIEIKSVLEPPFILDFCEFVNCPICDYEIEVLNTIVDNNSTINCENCEHNIKFECVKI